jgi:hypothetical protein
MDGRASEDEILEVALHVRDRHRMISDATSTTSDLGSHERIAI